MAADDVREMLAEALDPVLWVRMEREAVLDALLPTVERLMREARAEAEAAAINRVIDDVACDPRMQIYVGMLRARAEAAEAAS